MKLKMLKTLKKQTIDNLHKISYLLSVTNFLAGILVYYNIAIVNLLTRMEKEQSSTEVKETQLESKSYCPTTVHLKNYLTKGFENILKNVTDEKFIHIYKTCYKEFEKKNDLNRVSLSGSSVEAKKYHTQFDDLLIKSISETIDETISDMDCKLKKLESFKNEQAENMVIWRPPGNVEKHMIPFEFLNEMDRKKNFEDKIQKERETLNVLKNRLLQKRSKAVELHEVMQLLTNNIKNMVTNKINNEDNN